MERSCFHQVMFMLALISLLMGLLIWGFLDRPYYEAGKGEEGTCELERDPVLVESSEGPLRFQLFFFPQDPFFPANLHQEIKPNFWNLIDLSQVRRGYRLPCFSNDFEKLPVVLDQRPPLGSLALFFLIMGGVGTGIYLCLGGFHCYLQRQRSSLRQAPGSIDIFENSRRAQESLAKENRRTYHTQPSLTSSSAPTYPASTTWASDPFSSDQNCSSPPPPYSET